jgi:hypothetical protein
MPDREQVWGRPITPEMPSHFGPPLGKQPVATRPSPASSAARKFGELLVGEHVITAAQLEEALRVQAVSTAYLPLGQILVMKKVLTRKQLTTLLNRYKKRSQLGELLLKAGRLTEEQLQTALAHQQRTGMRLGEALIRLKYVTEETLRDTLCTQLHINFFDLDWITLDRSLRTLINEKYAAKHLVVPLFRAGPTLVVAMDDPTKVGLIDDLQMRLSLQIEVVTTTTAKLQRALARLYGEAEPPDPGLFGHRNVMVGVVRDSEIADLAVKVLRVRILPPGWQ